MSGSTLTLRLEAYARDAKELVAGAQSLADERKNPEVEPLHLFYLILERNSPAQDIVRRAGVDPGDLLLEAEAELRRLPRIAGVPAYLSPRTLDLLGRAEGEAARAGGVQVSIGHLLLACAQETDGGVKTALKACGLSAPILRAMLAGQSLKSDTPAGRSEGGAARPEGAPDGDPIEQFGRDLTRLAAQGKFDPTVGRDAELRRVLQVLARRRENNPLLIGETGIGKTAIVHALAQRIVLNDVPSMLKGKRIVALEMGSLVAGAKLRGQLEERMRSVLNAIRDASGEILLFLPELGSIAGKQSQGAGDLLAAALNRGELHCIAVATPDEVRKAFDEDSSLARRFVPIPVEPPTLDEAVAVLRGVVGRFEIDHGVRIADPALVAACQFARRYVPGVQLPKSAIDLIDEAAARVRVEMESVPAELDSLSRRLEAIEIQMKSLEDDNDDESERSKQKLAGEREQLGPRIRELKERWQGELKLTSEVRRLKEELGAAQRELEQARAGDNQPRAGELRFGTIPLVEKQLAEAEEKLRTHGSTLVHDTVYTEDVADVVAAVTGVPVAKMMEEETEKLLKMEERLRERVVGQEHALTAVCKAVRRGRVGLRDPRKPIGSFLFLGPSGVGKTELAKALAEFLFDDEAALTRLDMSEFMEKHMVARLLGSPPGYVDSDQGGFLTEAVRQRPYSCILFDEMEKAHPDVFNITLQMLDDGRLTDSRGRVAHFADTVIIMTSNVGSHFILDHKGTNEELRDRIEKELHRHFRPEFLNRIDEICIFDPLDRKELLGIVDIQLRALAKLLNHRRMSIDVTLAAKELIVDLGYEPTFGARPLKRVILKQLQDPLAETLLRGGYLPGDTVRVDVADGKFTFTKVP